MRNTYFFKIIKYTWPPLVVAMIIYYLCCLMPVKDIPDIELEFFIPTDKIVHYLMYFVLSGLASFYYIYDNKGKIIILKLIAFAILLPILYGGLIELVQHYYIEGRSGDWYDFLADALGSLTILPMALWFRRKLLNKEDA